MSMDRAREILNLVRAGDKSPTVIEITRALVILGDLVGV
jgi:hypothetical protein